MSLVLKLMSGLKRRGRLAPPRRFCIELVSWFDRVVLLAPAAALVWRARQIDGASQEVVAGFALAAMAIAITIALGRTVWQRVDVRVAARRLDRDLDAEERFAASVDAVSRDHSSLFVSLLLEDAAERLEAAPVVRSRGHLRPPRVMRTAFVLILAWLILILPGWGRGFIDRPVDEVGGTESIADGTGTERSGGRGARAGGLGDRIHLTVGTDRRVYGLGEEIQVVFQLNTKENGAPNTELATFARINGETVIEVPVELIVPEVAGEAVVEVVPFKALLEKHDLYRRGLVTIDPFVVARDDPGDPVAGNRNVIQISENLKKTRAPRNRPSAPKKTPKKKKPSSSQSRQQRNKDRKKPQKKKPSGGGRRPGDKPPGPINAKPYVLDPIISGDKMLERETRVFDRDIVDSDRPPSAAAEDKRRARGYLQGLEKKMLKVPLPPVERRTVKRYLDSIRIGPKKKDG